MVYYTCDACGKSLLKNDLRYKVKIEVLAVYEKNEIHLKDLIQNHYVEIEKLIKEMESITPEELESQIYKRFEFDLCPSCHKKYISNPKAGLDFKISNNETDYNTLRNFLKHISDKD